MTSRAEGSKKMSPEKVDIRCQRCDKITPHIVVTDSCCSGENTEYECTNCGLKSSLGGTVHDLP
jgi:hypothetical protein